MSAATLLKIIQTLGLTVQAKRLKKLMVKWHLWPKGGFGYSHRNRAYQMLEGRGLEVGALHCPARIPSRCEIQYCDAHSKEESIKLFPEIEASLLVDVDYIVNLDEDRISEKVMPPYDFAVMNHVIEHVANPIMVVEQLFKVVRPGGKLIISAPDKDYTFDKPRQLTPFSHLLDEYKSCVSRVEDDHYLDFIRHTAPDIFNSENPELLAAALKSVRDRREHAHVWDSESFLDFLGKTMDHLEIEAEIKFVSKASANNIECFVVLEKRRG